MKPSGILVACFVLSALCPSYAAQLQPGDKIQTDVPLHYIDVKPAVKHVKKKKSVKKKMVSVHELEAVSLSKKLPLKKSPPSKKGK